MSYHVKEIPRGVYGEISKIVEEVQELQDAEEQGARLMAGTGIAEPRFSKTIRRALLNV